MMRRHLCCHDNSEVECRSCEDMYIPYDILGVCEECLYEIVQEEAQETNLLKEKVGSLEEKVGSLEVKVDSLQEKVGSHEEKVDFLQATVDFLRLSSLDHGSNSTFTDVVLIACEDGAASPPIPAHKTILGSRSPVFKAMFETNMEESRSSTVKINDVSHDVLGTFVNYLYTAEACLNEQMACDLLVVSEKYQVEHLKNHCEKFLVSKLSPENSLMGYVFAQQHNTKHLLDAAFKQVTENMLKVIESEGYKELKKKDPVLVAEIFEARLADRAINYLAGGSSIGPRKDKDFECWLGDQFIKLLSAEPLT